MTDSSPHPHWQTAVHAYARHLNDYVARGDACDWEGMGQPDDPPELSPLLPLLMEQLRAANAQRDAATLATFRSQWPPLHEATQPLLEDNAQGIGALAWLPDGSLLVRTGAWYEPGQVWMVRGLETRTLPDVAMFGASPDRQLIALAGDGRLRIMRGGEPGPIAELPLPPRDEALPPTLADLAEDDAVIQQLIPFNDGLRAVVVRADGVFLCRQDGIQRLLPTAAELQEQADDEDPCPVRLDMVHAAVSPDGRWIACGQQDGRHRIFDGHGQAVCEIGPHGEYPHHAAFFADGRQVALNACHFYNGATIAVDIDAFDRIDTDFYEDHPAVRVVDPGGRIYASAPVAGGLVLGDAYGYLRAVDATGTLLWKQHVGSTLSAMATSADGRMLAVGSFSGTVHLIDLHSAEANPEQVGARAHREVCRWLFWKQEASPLAW
ncbi:hypothetical protein ABB26_11370 [Stenotrophomonas humi]|uniref:Uncharacterized protein n=1 Tax=Stenotrophomonas humi TaxID=405444 RepID=A0A0R0CDS1_9GAMM|nr:hypothetical protein [Stenotrophomonas humi]KRG63523.1 hypothetical protein ABB26_11370 [Stenotrophomonas humi]